MKMFNKGDPSLTLGGVEYEGCPPTPGLCTSIANCVL